MPTITIPDALYGFFAIATDGSGTYTIDGPYVTRDDAIATDDGGAVTFMVVQGDFKTHYITYAQSTPDTLDNTTIIERQNDRAVGSVAAAEAEQERERLAGMEAAIHSELAARGVEK